MPVTHLQFSQIIRNLSSNETDWFKRYFDNRAKGLDVDGGALDSEEGTPFPGFQFSIKTGSEEWGTYAWFYATAAGNVLQVAEVAQTFLKLFRPKDFFSLTWAEWSEGWQVGQFDGGALFVTAEEVETFHAGEWAYMLEKDFIEARRHRQGVIRRRKST